MAGKSLPSLPSLLKYVRSKCPLYDPKKILFCPKQGSEYTFVIVRGGQLYTEKFYDSSYFVDRLVGKFNFYLETNIWDDCVWYQPYTSVPGKSNETLDYGLPIICKSEKHFQAIINSLRASNPLGQNLGFREVGRTDKFITPEQFMGKT
jgi:hypothetical protein